MNAVKSSRKYLHGNKGGQYYEKQYHQNLAKGRGLNSADALSKALKAKQYGRGSVLTNRLDYYANILKQDGPMTTKDADRVLGNA